MNGVILSPDRPRCKLTFDLIKMLGTCKHPAGKAKKGKKREKFTDQIDEIC